MTYVLTLTLAMRTIRFLVQEAIQIDDLINVLAPNMRFKVVLHNFFICDVSAGYLGVGVEYGTFFALNKAYLFHDVWVLEQEGIVLIKHWSCLL